MTNRFGIVIPRFDSSSLFLRDLHAISKEEDHVHVGICQEGRKRAGSIEGRREEVKDDGSRWRRVNNRWTPNPVGTQRDIFGGISCPGQKAGGWSRRGTVDKTQRVINGLGLVA